MQRCTVAILAALCNTSLQTGVVPALLKTAIITPRLKKPGMDINTAQSYRPISNLSFLSKLLERVVGGHIQSFLDLHSLLPHFQSAYRRGFSTETALVKVYADLITALDSNTDSHAVLTLLDITEAFDTVDHSILLQLLQRLQRSCGISGNPLAWFTSYLAAREQSVRSRDKQSPSCHVPHGVPQGSVLKPLLFILYVADAAEIPERHGLGSHFMPTTLSCTLLVVVMTATCASRVSNCIKEIDQWTAANRLAMNPAKTDDVLWCSTSHQPSDPPLCATVL